MEDGVAVEISPNWALNEDAVREQVGDDFTPITQPTFLDEVRAYASQT